MRFEIMRINEVIIAEGKYDEAAIKQVCDATVITTRGFRIFKDAELRSWIRDIAKKRGIIVLTDSDGAGFKIRQYIESFVDKKYIKNAYIPTIKGKESRKEKPSAEGLLGVEGVPKDAIISALEKAGATPSEFSGEKITKTDLYAAGIYGKDNCVERKRALLSRLSLPLRLSNTKLVEALNMTATKEEFEQLVKEL